TIISPTRTCRGMSPSELIIRLEATVRNIRGIRNSRQSNRDGLNILSVLVRRGVTSKVFDASLAWASAFSGRAVTDFSRVQASQVVIQSVWSWLKQGIADRSRITLISCQNTKEEDPYQILFS